METFTIAEAAELTGLTKKALRHRVDRGQIHADKHGHIRHIARSELERVGLVVAQPSLRPADPAQAERIEALRTALAAAQRRVDDAERALARERALRAQAEARVSAAIAERERERERSRRLLEASPLERRRLARESDESDRSNTIFFRRVVVDDEAFSLAAESAARRDVDRGGQR